MGERKQAPRQHSTTAPCGATITAANSFDVGRLLDAHTSTCKACGGSR